MSVVRNGILDKRLKIKTHRRMARASSLLRGRDNGVVFNKFPPAEENWLLSVSVSEIVHSRRRVERIKINGL